MARVVDKVLQTAILTNHLTQTLPRLPRKFFPHIQVVVVKGVDHLASDDERGSADEPLSDCIGVMSVWAVLADVVGVAAAIHVVLAVAVTAWVAISAVLAASEAWVRLRIQGHLRVDAASRAVLTGFNAREINHDIEVIDQISSSIESQLRVAAKHHLSVEWLLDRFHSEVRVSRIPEAPESDGWVLG